MKKELTVSLFDRPKLPDYMAEILANDPAARVRLLTTMHLHSVANQLHAAGAPQIQLSVFEVGYADFDAALKAAGIEWITPAHGYSVTYYWDAKE